jgi:hypothetical protein
MTEYSLSDRDRLVAEHRRLGQLLTAEFDLEARLMAADAPQLLIDECRERQADLDAKLIPLDQVLILALLPSGGCA